MISGVIFLISLMLTLPNFGEIPIKAGNYSIYAWVSVCANMLYMFIMGRKFIATFGLLCSRSNQARKQLEVMQDALADYDWHRRFGAGV